MHIRNSSTISFFDDAVCFGEPSLQKIMSAVEILVLVGYNEKMCMNHSYSSMPPVKYFSVMYFMFLRKRNCKIYSIIK